MGAGVSTSTFHQERDGRQTGGIDVFVVSDLHTDHGSNFDTILSWPDLRGRAGDDGAIHARTEEEGVGSDHDMDVEEDVGSEHDTHSQHHSKKEKEKKKRKKKKKKTKSNKSANEQQIEVIESVLICAGDISTSLSLLRETLRVLKQKFDHVLYIVGNNELRLDRKERRALRSGESYTSVDKHRDVEALCLEEGIIIRPIELCGVVFKPILAWYTPEFDPHFDGSTEHRRGWLDFRACVWPDELCASLDGISSYFLDITKEYLDPSITREDTDASDEFAAPSSTSSAADQVLRTDEKFVITFSHFLPRRELLPAASVWIRPTIPFVVGEGRIDTLIREQRASIHVYGHTHINDDRTVDGVRYIQHAFGHPGERWRIAEMVHGSYKPKLIHCARTSQS
eukprot:TRINITY_DN2887_c0_g1_i1.p1 TRINITY_DN2887_c0_g1~~TRINITY_DN2887_c0_g1_i1.p1  ORF type:complete len:397 (-),score=68.69 TRINITY_DN2887_c0_g1_i1:263-1453(-)